MEEDNTHWLEVMKGGFEFELAGGDYVNCKKIIASLKEEGFTAEARELYNQLMEATLGDFLVEGIKEY